MSDYIKSEKIAESAAIEKSSICEECPKFNQKLVDIVIESVPFPTIATKAAGYAASIETLATLLRFIDKWCDMPASKKDEIAAKREEIYETLGDIKTADDLKLAIELYVIEGDFDYVKKATS